MKKLYVFETFAGIGAQHKALNYLKKKYGYDFEVVATSEWDLYANISYNAIHHNGKIDKKTPIETINKFFSNGVWSKDGKTPAKIKTILNLSNIEKRKAYSSIKNANNLGTIIDINGQNLLEKTNNKIDLITYSFPCQDLSVAGSFHGFNKGMEKGSGTRSGLLWEIERIVKDLKKLNKLPKFLLLENVLNMVSSRHIEHYNEWLKELKKLGYSTRTFKLNAYDFGLPQSRRRIYALSILNYKGKTNKFGEIIDIDDPKIETSKKTIKELLKTNYNDQIQKEEALQAQPNRTPSRERMFKNNYKLCSGKHNYARTITTKQDRHPNAGVINLENTLLGGNNRIIGKANYRFMTPRETYLFMGFEDKDFNAVKKENIRKEKLYQQAGNSIAVNVLISIFKLMYEYW